MLVCVCSTGGRCSRISAQPLTPMREAWLSLLRVSCSVAARAHIHINTHTTHTRTHSSRVYVCVCRPMPDHTGAQLILLQVHYRQLKSTSLGWLSCCGRFVSIVSVYAEMEDYCSSEWLHAHTLLGLHVARSNEFVGIVYFSFYRYCNPMPMLVILC